MGNFCSCCRRHDGQQLSAIQKILEDQQKTIEQLRQERTSSNVHEETKCPQNTSTITGPSLVTRFMIQLPRIKGLTQWDKGVAIGLANYIDNPNGSAYDFIAAEARGSSISPEIIALLKDCTLLVEQKEYDKRNCHLIVGKKRGSKGEFPCLLTEAFYTFDLESYDEFDMVVDTRFPMYRIRDTPVDVNAMYAACESFLNNHRRF